MHRSDGLDEYTDHYRTLQVTRDAEPEVIERAYKALALKYHPDVVSPDVRAAAETRMKAINRAYETLRDPRARALYDGTLIREGERAWDRFMEDGLIGLFRDRRGASGGR